MRWPDVELLAVRHFGASLTARVVTVLPSNLEAEIAEHGGVIRVTRGPGSDNKITDAPLLDVEVFTATRAQMWDLAEDAREAAHALAGIAVGGALVDTVNTALDVALTDRDVIGSYADDQRAWWGAPQAGLIDEFANVENGYGFLIESVQYAPGLVGSAVSNGCLRMRNADITRLANTVEIGTPVQIA